MELEPEFKVQSEQLFENKKNRLKNNWIKKMKNLDPDDEYYDVVFTDVPELHGEVKLQVSGRPESTISMLVRNSTKESKRSIKT